MVLPYYNFAESEFPTYWKVPVECAGRILVGGLFPENYFLIDFTSHKLVQVTINSENHQRQMASFIESVLNQDQLPYGVKEISKFPLDFLHPHEGLAIGYGQVAIALNNASCIRLIDFNRRTVTTLPEVEPFRPVMLSATNSFLRKRNAILYTETSLTQRLESFKTPLKTLLVETNVKMYDIRTNTKTTVFKLQTSEAPHEISLSQDEKYAFISEFRVDTKYSFSASHHVDTTDDFLNEYKLSGLHDTRVLCIDLEKQELVSSLEFNNTPGHVKQSLSNENHYYLSCHNLSKAYQKILLHGQAELVKFKVSNGEMSVISRFTDQRFFRTTSHIVFNYENRNYLAAISYPNKLYLFDDATFTLLKTVTLFPYHEIPAGDIYVCEYYDNIPLWIEVSNNSKYIIMVSNRYIYIFDMFNESITCLSGYSANCNTFFVTSHLKNIDRFHANISME